MAPSKAIGNPLDCASLSPRPGMQQLKWIVTVTWTPSDMRILYLEDEAIIAMETVETLREMGFQQIDMAYSLPAAERLVADARPDIALLDVNLSHGRTSIDLGQRLLGEGVPVVFATGYASGSLPADPRATVIEKPVTPGALERALTEAAAHPES
ncbi:response regulator receiver domain-containing protein [Cereibacter ovatus]|uniref:Response regulator receiver domain-containing protein n=1 Tax=Cereibacter ovatus TaxID=439529 RepID=A0A285CJC9_9RHOB|nr:response regulator receiver domain-containing protein [Cereibacter ovatus]